MHVQKFACFCVNLLQFADFPVNNAKTIMHNWKCKAIDSFYLVSSIELVLTINLTLLLCFFIFSFILLCWIPSLLSTPRYLFTPSWPNSCISVSLSITIFSVEVSLPFLKLALAHYQAKFHTDIMDFFNYFQFSDLFVFVLSVKFEIIHIKTDCWLEHLRFWSYNHTQM